MPIRISPDILEKLHKKHGVTEKEVEQCFANRDGKLLRDTREEHRTDPPTEWFIAETNKGRELKIVFIRRGADVSIKSAYEPSAAAKAVYEKLAR